MTPTHCLKLRFAALRDDVERMGADHPFTALVPDLSSGADPDDSFSRVPYEKGALLLSHLEVRTVLPSRQALGSCSGARPAACDWVGRRLAQVHSSFL